MSPTPEAKAKWRGKNWQLYKATSDIDKIKWTKAQGAIKRMILDSLDESLTGHVLGKNSGTDMWRALSDHFDGKAGTAVTMTQQRKLQHKLRSAKMKKGSDMAQHLNELFLIQTKLEATSYKVNDSEMVEAILRSLPDAYRVSHDIVRFYGTDYTAEKLRNALLLKHEDLASGDTTTKSTPFGSIANSTVGGRGGRGKDTRRGRGRGQRKGRGQDGNTGGQRSTKECFACKRTGHTAKQRYWLKNQYDKCFGDKDSNQHGTRHQAGSTQYNVNNDSVDDDGIGYVADSIIAGSTQRKKKTTQYRPELWYLDSGDNVHIVGSKEYFTDFTPFEKDAKETQVQGVSAQFNTTAGYEVYYDNDAGSFELVRNGTVVLRAHEDNRLWPFRAHNRFLRRSPTILNYVVANANIQHGRKDMNYWHNALGHINTRSIRDMANQGLVQISKTYHDNVHRRASRTNDLIFADLMDFSANKTTKFRYLLVIVDAFSNFTSVFLLQKKSETNLCLEEYIAWAEIQQGRPIKQVLTDKGGEFVNAEISE
ncbi:TPA: hypothetical protein N0F65_005418 [Lagenidium giganteum]|uniref:Integrase catalytic domain-containing protein n=1 Tax=Lagenidium giganteum TaxID=4803 RepID=A0AAV2Z233_9STRA|nr:TPA: hypothetical protein N0F65_005418 [Lagenidium giganteum]